MEKKGKREVSFIHIDHPIFKLPRTIRQRLADRIAGFAGSWFFLMLLILLVTSWIYFNETKVFVLDPKPYILLNLVLNIIAVVLGPIILMSQKRQEERDRIRAMYDHNINLKSEKEIEELQKDVKEIKAILIGRKKR